MLARALSLLLLSLIVVGCDGASSEAPASRAPTPPAPTAGELRERQGLERLEADAEAGQKLIASIAHHGGLANFYDNGALHFRFRYEPMSGEGVRETSQWIDTQSSRAVHKVTGDESVRFGWDGERAWYTEGMGAHPKLNPRFWALTPYYFLGIPFVLADPGVNVSAEPDIEYEGKRYEQVKVSYESGTGDSPGDYYIVLLDPETKRVGGVRYIVSYPGFFPDGGHSPEKLMLYDGEQTVEGPAGSVKLAAAMRSFKLDAEGAITEQATRVTISEVRFASDAHPAPGFDVPQGATLQEGYMMPRPE